METSGQFKKLKEAKKEALFSEFHSLLTAGMDFNRSFGVLIENEEVPAVRRVLEEVYASVVDGKSLWESFKTNGSFTPLDYGVVRIGEETGRIGESLYFLSEYYRKRVEQRRMITSAVSYPLIILFTAVVVLVFMVMVIVPMFEQVYARMGGELPWLTRMMIAFSAHFPVFLAGMSLLFAGTALFFWRYGRTDGVRSFVASVLLKIPAFGASVRKNQEARFCKLLWLLYSSGIPLLRAVEMLRDIITFYPYQKSFDAIGEGLKRGELFAENLSRFPGLYNRKLCALLRVGEETNHLDEMLWRQSDELTKELEYRLKQLGNLLEPLLILGVGTLVALVLISMYLPMFRLGGVVG